MLLVTHVALKRFLVPALPTLSFSDLFEPCRASAASAWARRALQDPRISTSHLVSVCVCVCVCVAVLCLLAGVRVSPPLLLAAASGSRPAPDATHRKV